MARGSNTARFRDFHRGLNTADGVYNLADGEARALLNVVSLDRGNVKKRPGCATLQSTSGVKDLSAVDTDTAGLLLYSTTGGKLLALDDAGTETSLVASGLSATAPWTFIRAPVISTFGPYWGMNGVDTPRYVTATPTVGNWTAAAGTDPAATYLATLPNGKYMVYAGNRVWVAGVASDPYSVFWSDLGNPRAFDEANVTEFGVDDGQPITGLAAIGNYVLVFKERAVWRIYDLDTSANVKVGDNLGTLSPRSIVPTEQGCFFLDSENGITVLDGSSVKRISDQILPTLRRISDADLATVDATVWQGHYYLAARLDSVTRYLLDYDMALDSWWLHSHQARAVETWDRGSGRILLGAHPSTIAHLMVAGESLDEDVVFDSYWSGAFHDFGAPNLRKRCRELQIDGSGTANVYVHADFLPGPGTLEQQAAFSPDADTFGGAGTFGGTGTFGGGVSIGEDSLLSLGVGRVWSMTIGSVLAKDWEMDSYIFMYDRRKD